MRPEDYHELNVLFDSLAAHAWKSILRRKKELPASFIFEGAVELELAHYMKGYLPDDLMLWSEEELAKYLKENPIEERVGVDERF